MKKRYLWYGSSVLILVLIAVVLAFGPLKGLFSQEPDLDDQKESNVPVDSRIVSANAQFGIDLFKQLVKSQPDENVFISPTSLSLALSMTYNGAKGDTRKAMVQTLAIQGLSLEDLNYANSALIANLNEPGPGVRFTIANSLWGDKKVDFNRDFLRRNRDSYDAYLRTLDFDNPKAAQIIDNWIKDKTKGRIDRIVERINPAEILFLVNAVHFLGKWTEPFKKERTMVQDFYLSANRKKTVQMMINELELKYYKSGDFQAVSLPYGKGRMSMYIFLPNKDSSLDSFISNLTLNNWQKWMLGFNEAEVYLSLPRFELEYTADDELKEALTALGMGAAFDSRADFSGICSEQVWLSRVVHKTFLKVDEEGTEAAAATAVGMETLALPMEPVEFVVDHPFFCVIRDNKTGEILFMGSVVDPM